MADRTNIPFNKPFIVGRELQYIEEAVSGGQISGDGIFSRRCSEFFERRFGIAKVLMTPSCTAALEMAAILCDLKPGDEVIMPSYTFVSTANAVALKGARPVFVDIRDDTLNLDVAQIERAVSPRTKAIFAVHYAGVACDMDAIMAIAGKHDLLVVEDAAQGVNAFYNRRPLGSIGHLGTYSFHETKNYICGEGGALCINRSEMIERAIIVRDKGTDRQRFFRGEVDKYTWVDIGSSYVASDIVCAFLYAQLELLDEITSRRRALYQAYYEQLQPLEDEGRLRLPTIPSDCCSNFHMFYIVLNDASTRDGLLAHLLRRGIGAVIHYVPLHSSSMGRNVGVAVGDMSVTEEVSSRLVRLPMYYEMDEEAQGHVVHEVTSFLRPC